MSTRSYNQLASLPQPPTILQESKFVCQVCIRTKDNLKPHVRISFRINEH